MRIRWLLLFALFIMAVFSDAHAAEIKDSDMVSHLWLHITFSGKVSVPGEIKKIDMNLSFPQNTPTQKVTTTSSLVYDSFGNQLLHIVRENPSNPFYYSAHAMVESKCFILQSLPENYTLSSYEKQFLEATKNIQSNKYEIQKLAEEITRGCEDDFERIAKLAIWVNEHVEYDLKCSQKNYDALWVLKNRRGVCSEYATLFIALARALGFPARYVGGYAYGKKGWEPHAYAEVFLGKWIPVDPLWLQVGYLDATHIKTCITKDNKIKEDIEVVGYGVKKIKWKKNPPEFRILGINYRGKEKEYELFPSAYKLTPGDKFLVVWKYLPKEYGVAELDLEPCIGNAVKITGEKRKKVILEPGKMSVIVWKLKVNENLKHGYIYTCPLTLNSNLFKSRELDITITTVKKPEKLGIKAWLSSSEIEIGKNQTVFIDITHEEGRSVGIIYPYGKLIKEVKIGKKAELEFSFFPEKLGKNEVYIYTSTGDVLELPFFVIESSDIYVKINAPDFLRINQTEAIRISIMNKNKTLTGKLKLVITYDGKKNIRELIIPRQGTKEINEKIKFSEPGYKIIKITLEGDRNIIKFYKIVRIRVYTKPEIKVALVKYDTKNKTVVFSIRSEKDKALNISISMNGKTKIIKELEGEEVVTFKGVEEASAITLCYYDLGGKRYCRTMEIEIEVNFVQSIIQKLLKIFHTFYELFTKRFIR